MFASKIKPLLTFKRCLSSLALLSIILLNITGVLSAQSVTQGYNTSKTLQRGMIVGLTEDNGTMVEAISVDELSRMMGIVVDANDSPITLSGETEKVFVATIGRYDVLVSDQNGAINPGDYVTASSLEGIGMLATFQESDILGRAITGFNGADSVVTTDTLTDSDNATRSVNIGRIQMDIAVSKNPVAKSAAVTP